MVKIRVEKELCDVIEVTDGKLVAKGCFDLLKLLNEYKSKHGASIDSWPLPLGATHPELLLKETLLKHQGRWVYPYLHEELCHCRAVLTKTVDQAIISGAHTCEKVSRMTSASTACGTCKPDVQSIIDYRLKRPS